MSPGVSVLDGAGYRSTNSRFFQPYQPGSGIFVDRTVSFRTIGTGFGVGFGGADELLINGPGVESASVWSLGERDTDEVEVLEQSSDGLIVRGDPMGEVVIEGMDPFETLVTPADLPEDFIGEHDPFYLAALAEFDSWRPGQIRGMNLPFKGGNQILYDDHRIPLPPDAYDNPDFMRNGSEIQWSERIQPTFSKGAGFLSWEATFRIFRSICAAPSSKMRAIQISIPTQASLNYARRLGQLARDMLPENTEVLVAHGNEVWNTAPPYKLGYEWSSARGEERGLQTVTPDGDTLGGDAYTSALLFHAVRTAELGEAFREGYEDHGSVQTVFEWHSANMWGVVGAVEYARTFGPIDAIAGAPYFGHGIDLPQLSREQAIQALSDDLDRVMSEDHAYMQETSEALGVPMLTYEQNHHVTNFSGWPGDKSEWGRAFEEIVTSEEMAVLHKRQIADWESRGGVLPTAYADFAYPNDAEMFALDIHPRKSRAPTWVCFSRPYGIVPPHEREHQSRE